MFYISSFHFGSHELLDYVVIEYIVPSATLIQISLSICVCIVTTILDSIHLVGSLDS